MDHIVLPQSPRFRSLDLEYTGGAYDGGEFASYPRRRGFDTRTGGFSEAADPLWESRSSQEKGEAVKAFYQTWLYFGLIHHFFGAAADQTLFLRVGDDGRKRYLATDALP